MRLVLAAASIAGTGVVAVQLSGSGAQAQTTTLQCSHGTVGQHNLVISAPGRVALGDQVMISVALGTCVLDSRGIYSIVPLGGVHDVTISIGGRVIGTAQSLGAPLVTDYFKGTVPVGNTEIVGQVAGLSPQGLDAVSATVPLVVDQPKNVTIIAKFDGTRKVSLSCPTASGTKNASATIAGLGVNAITPPTVQISLGDTPTGPCSIQVLPGATANNTTFFTVSGLCAPVGVTAPQGPGFLTLPFLALAAEGTVPCPAFGEPTLSSSVTVFQSGPGVAQPRSAPITYTPTGVMGTVTLIEGVCPVQPPYPFPPGSPLYGPQRNCSYSVDRISIPGVVDALASSISGFDFTITTPPNPPAPVGAFYGPAPKTLPLPLSGTPVNSVIGHTYGKFGFLTGAGFTLPLLSLSPSVPTTTTVAPTTVAPGQFKVVVSPSSIRSGDVVTLTASGLSPADGRVDFTIGGLVANTAFVKADGTATSTFRWYAVDGTYPVVASWVRFPSGVLTTRSVSSSLTIGVPTSSSSTTVPPTTAPPTTAPPTTAPPTTAPPTTRPSGLLLTATPSSLKVGANVTLKVSGTGVSSGRVDFTIAGIPVGTSSIGADGSAVLTVPVWSVGSSVTVGATVVTYSGGIPSSRSVSTAISVISS